MSQFYSSINK